MVSPSIGAALESNRMAVAEYVAAAIDVSMSKSAEPRVRSLMGQSNFLAGSRRGSCARSSGRSLEPRCFELESSQRPRRRQHSNLRCGRDLGTWCANGFGEPATVSNKGRTIGCAPGSSCCNIRTMGALPSRNTCGFRPTIRCTIACRFFDAVVRPATMIHPRCHAGLPYPVC